MLTVSSLACLLRNPPDRHDITAEDVRAFNAELQKTLLKKHKAGLTTYQPMSARRVNTVMQLLRTVCAQAVIDDKIQRDPTLSVKRVKLTKSDVDPLSREELEVALAAIPVHYQPIFITLAFTGARPNELLALRWGDVDWQKKLLDINKGRVRGVEGPPKTKAGVRKIPMSAQVIDTLRTLKESTMRSIDGYVFTKPDGKPIDKHLDRIWNAALRKAHVRPRKSYQLRHTFATHCIEKGVPFNEIMRVLGHASLDSLIRNYAGYIKDTVSDRDDKIRAVFDGLSLPGDQSREKSRETS